MSRWFAILIVVMLSMDSIPISVRANEPGKATLTEFSVPKDATPPLPGIPIQGSPTEPFNAPNTPTYRNEAGEYVELPPLEEELHQHGGSYLYEPIDVSSALYADPSRQHEPLRLPECWLEPQPLSLPEEYLGSHFIDWSPDLRWFGCNGSTWEPRLVGYGSYEIFGTFYEQNQTRRDGIGHQLRIDFDLALTGTERLHVQFRPFGEENTGGSFWQLNDPDHYIDNATGVPQRWWIEGELQSLFGGLISDDRLQLDINYTIGRFPFQLHNSLLMNDEIVGIVIGKNSNVSTKLSDINMQAFYAIDEVDSVPRGADLYGLHFSGDYRHAFLEGTIARLQRGSHNEFESNYIAGSATQFIGPVTIAGRAMARFGDSQAAGDGQLYVLESNWTRIPSEKLQHSTGIEKAVTYFNIFRSNGNWSPIAGGNFDRLRNSFAVNPLLTLAAATTPIETQGAALGVQLFRHHEDESFIPEIAWEERSSDRSWGVGLKYQRKLTSRTFVEVRGLKTWSPSPILRKEGVFLSTITQF